MTQTDDPLAAIRTSFFQECEELLEQLADALADPAFAATAPDQVNAAFRAVHSVKGGAASFELDQLSAFAHRFENTFDDLRAGRRRVDPALMRRILPAADHLSFLIEAARAGRTCVDRSDLLQALDQSENPASGDWFIRFRPTAALYATGNEPLHILNALLELGDARIDLSTETLPHLSDINPEEGYLSWQLRLPGTIAEQALRDCFDFVEDVCDLQITRAVGPALSQAKATADARRSAPAAGDGPTVRIDLDRIDRLMNLVGELVIGQSMLEQTIAPALANSHSPARTAFDTLTSLTSDLQDSVMAIRAQPVKPLFQRMSRILRDAAAVAGKEATIRFLGEMTEVDRSIIEGLTEPLTHMIRNAVDHGLEKPADRRALGKPTCGTVTLSAAHRVGRVLIELFDDGAGIDRARVRAVAVDRGLIDHDQRLTDAETDALLFHPGFSTAQAVTSLSGRGVGLDVVRAALSRLGGRITIESQPGQGTRFQLSLPLTLAVTDGMALRSGGQILLLPLASIRETVRVRGADIRRLDDGTELMQIRGQLVSLCDVAAVLGLPESTPHHDHSVAVLVADEDGRQAALIVDEIIDQRQVVIKGLRTNCGPVAGIAAATILGDGRVALILDPGDMVRRAGSPAVPPSETERLAG